MPDPKPLTLKQFTQKYWDNMSGDIYVPNAGAAEIKKYYQQYLSDDTKFYVDQHGGGPPGHSLFHQVLPDDPYAKFIAPKAPTPTTPVPTPGSPASRLPTGSAAQTKLLAAGLNQPAWLQPNASPTGGVALTNTQIDSWMRAYSRATGLKITDPKIFLSLPDVQAGNEVAKAALNPVLGGDVVPSQTFKVKVGGPANAGNQPAATVVLNAPQAQVVKAGINTTAQQELPGVLAAGQATDVPWQLIWGFIRGTTGWNARQAQAQGATTTPTALADVAKGASAASIFNPRGVAENLAGAYRQYHDWTLAVIATVYPDDAAAFAAGRVPHDHAQQITTLLENVFGAGSTGGPTARGASGNIDPNTGRPAIDPSVGIDQLGFGTNPRDNGVTPAQVFKALNATPVPVTVPDMTTYKTFAQSTIQNLLQRDPQPGEVDRLSQWAQALVMDALNQANGLANSTGAGADPFVPAAAGPTSLPEVPSAQSQQDMLLQRLQQTPEYKALYAHKGALTEQQYADLFKQAATTATGMAPQGAIRLGMQTGNPQEAAQAAGAGMLAGPGTEGLGTQTFREAIYNTAQKIQAII